ncbi:hypothetical protein U1Q18_037918 [Sarracenia purpurea var. burkii]
MVVFSSFLRSGVVHASAVELAQLLETDLVFVSSRILGWFEWSLAFQLLLGGGRILLMFVVISSAVTVGC